MMLAQKHAATGHHFGTQPVDSSQHTPPDKNIRILVVEDTEANILISRILIETLGYSMDIARNAQEALDKFKANSYSLVLLDLRMPGKDGYEICRELLDHEFQAGAEHTPVVALTAYATLAEQKRCKAAGMDDFLTKPIDSEKLVTMLSRHLK